MKRKYWILVLIVLCFLLKEDAVEKVQVQNCETKLIKNELFIEVSHIPEDWIDMNLSSFFNINQYQTSGAQF
jgi:hypothetical protein